LYCAHKQYDENNNLFKHINLLYNNCIQEIMCKIMKNMN
jgi:hypothetical protein